MPPWYLTEIQEAHKSNNYPQFIKREQHKRAIQKIQGLLSSRDRDRQLKATSASDMSHCPFSMTTSLVWLQDAFEMPWPLWGPFSDFAVSYEVHTARQRGMRIRDGDHRTT